MHPPSPPRQPLEELRDAWAAKWPEALTRWSRFTKLSEPRWCFSPEEEAREGLIGSFAMIRLVDQAVVISLRQIAQRHLERFAAEIMAHEIGHHVYCPANLLDQGRMLARMRRGLPTKEHLAPLVANLYADLLVNNRLQRGQERGSVSGLEIARVYQTLGGGDRSRVWTFYMRIYEILWSVQKGELAAGRSDPVLEGDAQLGARLIRSYGRDWLDGAGRFAVLILPYLLEDEGESMEKLLRGWLDTRNAGQGQQGHVPAGLTEIDEGELEGAVHPSEDPELTGLAEGEEVEPEILEESEGPSRGRNLRGGQRKHREYRGPLEYGEILKSLGTELDDHQIAARYYRERAIPYLVRFPPRSMPESTEPLPEGLESWDIGQPLEDADWLQSVLLSPHVIPGMTTVQRTYGTAPGSLPENQPVDLYLGVDCSGSMPNPQRALSYPVLAGTIIALSALRAGAKVMVVLSGEPGQCVSTDGFTAEERAVLSVLTGYLGTGYTFGIHRLRAAIPSRDRVPPAGRVMGAIPRAKHLLILTDHDIFRMLDLEEQGVTGWEIARTTVKKAGTGGTYVLHMPVAWEPEKIARMQADGWRVHHIQDAAELVAFARAFSQANYGEKDAVGTRRSAP